MTGDSATLEAIPVRGRARVLARNVSRLHVERQGELITIALAVDTPPGEIVLETTVRPRN
jgi:hypothetical protein